MASLINSDNGVSSGSAGLKSSADSSGVLQLQTNGTAALTVDTSQNVGIGTTTPTLYSGYTTLQVNNTSTSKGVVAVGPATTGGYLYSDGGQTSLTSLGATPLTLGTNNTERMRILTTGNILSLAGGSTTATGTGIAFPATQSASTDANTLDDYEEGTWTPVITPSSGTITSYTSSGFYCKIGREVFVYFQFSITNIGTANGTYGNYSGLPFTSSSSTSAFIGVCRENSVNGYLSQVTVGPGTTNGAILKYDNTGVLVNGGLYLCTVNYFV